MKIPTADKIPEALIDSAKSRTSNFFSKLESTMKIIETEIKENSGVYSFNNGSLNKSELCRRAKVNETVLHNERHKNTTLNIVKNWLGKMALSMGDETQGFQPSESNQTDWKKEHLKICTSYHIAEIKLENCRDENKLLKETISKLKKENSDLKNENLRLDRNFRIVSGNSD